MGFRYFVVYKPYGVLTQFSGGGSTLSELMDFPKDVYPVGRLDKDSEGLLLVTDDKKLNHFLLDPKYGHQRTYLVQVEGLINLEALQSLQSGVTITIDNKEYLTKRAKAKLLQSEPDLPPRVPPIRYRKHVPDCWISLTLTEGKNRQVRRMTAKVGYPTLRLVRWSIEGLTIEGMNSGQVVEKSMEEVYLGLGFKTGEGSHRFHGFKK
ncbi:Ribosomal large subunit pseudouridine synthase E [Lunatimonas lonarensis]|uniref:Pseudouridine synthase n=1 Tax=Lunatimonas lonarensis TaxID=1232681 RepID=R7ZYG0_9BACT|nr:pseudouridine synthase [Lunatimonas lonarensis]EON79141.1 Ribosomal large subunit pseudouridine synthase E [Lunatimonas lonarensis]